MIPKADKPRMALITGGMGGLGETISVKMADAGYRVAVTFSPANRTAERGTYNELGCGTGSVE